jgi:hypothetical protein
VERYGYERAGMTTIEADPSPLVMLAQPERVAELIQDAVRSTTVWRALRPGAGSRPPFGAISNRPMTSDRW